MQSWNWTLTDNEMTKHEFSCNGTSNIFNSVELVERKVRMDI